MGRQILRLAFTWLVADAWSPEPQLRFPVPCNSADVAPSADDLTARVRGSSSPEAGSAASHNRIQLGGNTNGHWNSHRQCSHLAGTATRVDRTVSSGIT